MRAALVTLASLTLVAAGCGGGGGGDSSGIASNPQAVQAVATPAELDPEILNSGAQDLDLAGMEPAESVYAPSPAGVAELLKQGDTLWLAGSSGLVAKMPEGARSLKDEPVAAAVFFADKLWIATEGALSTADGLLSIVPEFATAFTTLAVFCDQLYAGTDGNGVWKLEAGKLVPVSADWHVRDLAATGSGLFASTEQGLFSYQDDRWRVRQLDDTSTALIRPTVLYARHPYLYVGTESDLFRFDGGRWEQFGLTSAVTALGWNGMALYVGTASGALFAFEGKEPVTVPSPEAGAITAILRFDGRVHVATEEGVFRLLHGRFEKIDLEVPVESEPKHEPIAFLL